MRDRVSPELAEYVKNRDGACILSLLETAHRCRNQWGDPIAAFDLGSMTLEHVKSELRAGKRAPSDAAHLVTLCGYANVNVPSKAQRVLMRAYLAAREVAA